MEELGIECKLKYALSFQYHIPFDNGLIENELDHVYMGTTNRTPDFNLDEVMAIKYVNLNWLKSDMAINPNDYTYWFRLIMDKIAEND